MGIFREKALIGLDIGSRYIRAVVGQSHKRNFIKLLGRSSVPTRGFVDGTVTDLEELSSSVGLTLRTCLKKAGVRTYDTVVSVGGGSVEFSNVEGKRLLSSGRPRTVTGKDIKAVVNETEFLALPMDRKSLHTMPYDYNLDGQSSISNPLGLYGHKLGVNLAIVHAPSVIIQNMSKCIDYAGFFPKEFAFSGFADVIAVTGFKDRRNRILISLGSTNSTVMIIIGGIIRDFFMFPFGSAVVDNAIAGRWNASSEEVDSMKASFADLNLHKCKDGCADSSSENALPADKINCVIYSVLKENLKGLGDRCRQSKYCSNINDFKVYMIGGMTAIRGLDKCASGILGCSVKVPRVKGLIVNREGDEDPIYNTAIGLMKYGLFKGQYTFDSASAKDMGILTRVNDFFEEYF